MSDAGASVSDVAVRNCGTCHYWRGEVSDNFGTCLWMAPPMPFWAKLHWHDEAGVTKSTDGARCRTWNEREP